MSTNKHLVFGYVVVVDFINMSTATQVRSDGCHLYHSTPLNCIVGNSSVCAFTATGLGHVVRRMTRHVGRFVLNTSILIHNELLLPEKLLGKNPVFA